MLGAQLLFPPMKNKLGAKPQLIFSWGGNKSWVPNLFFVANIQVVKTFMASNLLFILENKSWGYKSNPKRIPKSCGPRQSQSKAQASVARVVALQIKPSSRILRGECAKHIYLAVVSGQVLSFLRCCVFFRVLRSRSLQRRSGTCLNASGVFLHRICIWKWVKS